MIDDCLNSYFIEVAAELTHRRARFGVSSDDNLNTPWMWVAYICQYSTRWMAGCFLPLDRAATDQFRTCMIKVATVALAAAMSVDRQRREKGRVFYEKDSNSGGDGFDL